jgi:hypothetical protein
LDLAWVIKYSRGEKQADLKGMDVFEFLAELAMKRTQAREALGNTSIAPFRSK